MVDRGRVKTFEHESAIYVENDVAQQFLTICIKCYFSEFQPIAGGFSDKYLSSISAAVRTNSTHGRTL